MTAPLFPTGEPAAHRRLQELASDVVDALGAVDPGMAWSGVDPEDLARAVAAIDPCPDEPVAMAPLLAELVGTVLAHGVRPTHPACAAHLHVPPLLSAAAAELAVGVTNQSMDSFDQAPAATLVEDHLVMWLGGLLGLPEGRSGVLTAGGTASNLLGLLLAREHASRGTTPGRLAAMDVGVDDPRSGLADHVVVASAASHFSVAQGAAVLGLGRRRVLSVAVDRRGRIDLDELDRTLERMRRVGLRPLALVGTAGTTDAGAIDDLTALADRARSAGAWFHVDAAVGGAFALSDRLRSRLAGVERADSVTVDLHKLWWQPLGASALLVRSADELTAPHQPSDYLDREEDDGILNLVGRSLDTSRRFDALKVLVSLRATGRRTMAGLVEGCVELADEASALVERCDDLELLRPPETVTVLFRWAGAGADPARLDEINIELQRALFASGAAIVGRTRLDGQVALKLTLVNPTTRPEDLAEVLDQVVRAGRVAAGRPHAPAEPAPPVVRPQASAPEQPVAAR